MSFCIIVVPQSVKQFEPQPLFFPDETALHLETAKDGKEDIRRVVSLGQADGHQPHVVPGAS